MAMKCCNMGNETLRISSTGPHKNPFQVHLCSRDSANVITLLYKRLTGGEEV